MGCEAIIASEHYLDITTEWVSILVNNSTEPSGQHYMDITTLVMYVDYFDFLQTTRN
jgi:hypothetical protein